MPRVKIDVKTLFVQQAVEVFLEEVVVRRELSDNYCHYEPNYDNIKGAAQWAQDSLEKHRSDEREYLYTLWVSLLVRV